MISESHLALRPVSLAARADWVNPEDGLVFLFPQAGGGEYTAQAVRHQIHPGNVLVLNGQLGSRLRAGPARALDFSFFSAHLEHLFPLFASQEISRLQDVTESLKATRLYAASNPLAAECHRLVAEAPPRFDLDHRAQLIRVAAAVLGAEFNSVRPHRAGFVSVEDHMSQVFERLSTDELLHLRVGELAARFGCSKRHLGRLFRKHFGFSAGAMRMEMRLLKAVSLLREPSAKVMNTAELCGFNNLGLFNTYFKRRFGASPTQYRKHLSPAESPAPHHPPNDVFFPPRLSGVWPAVVRPLNRVSARTAPAQRPQPLRVKFLVSVKQPPPARPANRASAQLPLPDLIEQPITPHPGA